ncbi:hypothetical protein PPIV_ORF104 [Pike-perch iridovirus]|uniref:Uncharacterized protein n=1 Tax=Pike-perch iridovirus TaxID=575979 RepID=A0A1B2ITW2_9VIRU|nr:hypothetical protein PPIV_ORF104 [Pike-perch iridovirus]
MCSKLVEMAFGPVNADSPPLTAEEKESAVEKLVGSKPFPTLKKKYHDKVPAQDPKYCLFSFVEVLPSCDIKAAGAEEMCSCCLKRRRGQVFGVACVRGTAQTLAKAKQKADKLVGDYDSVHVVQTCHVGRPFPLVSSGMAQETVAPSAMEAAEAAMDAKSAEKRKERMRQKLEMRKREQEIKARNRKLLEDPSCDPDAEEETDLERYATLRVKTTCLLENAKNATAQIKEYLASMRKSAEAVVAMEAADPTLAENYPGLIRDSRAKMGVSKQDTEAFLKMSSFDCLTAASELETMGF